jgi:hypothetical protein
MLDNWPAMAAPRLRDEALMESAVAQPQASLACVAASDLWMMAPYLFHRAEPSLCR